MTFNLSARDIDRVGAVPLYRQIADLIQTAIESGQLKPGDAIPSEPEMARTLGISRPQVREGVAELVRAGLVVKRHGAVSRVADTPMLRSLDTSRYQAELDLLDTGGEHPNTSAFAAEFGVDWSAYTIDTDYSRDKAGPADAERLAVPEGTPVFRRRFLKLVNGQPQQLQRSTIPADVARGTILEDERVQPYPGGTIAELFAAGHRVTSVVEEAWARMPTGDERRALQIQAAPV